MCRHSLTFQETKTIIVKHYTLHFCAVWKMIVKKHWLSQLHFHQMRQWSFVLLVLQYNSYMVSTIQHSMQNASEYTSQRVCRSDDSTASPSRLVGGVCGVECPQPALASLRPSSLLCAGRPVPSLDLRHAGGTYDEGTLEFLSAEMNFSALYMHDIHSWRLSHAATHTDEDERARQLWQTDSPTELNVVSLSHHIPNIQEGSEDEEAAAAAGRESDYLLSAGSSQTPQVWRLSSFYCTVSYCRWVSFCDNVNIVSPFDTHCCHMGTATKRQSAWMSKITNDGLTWSVICVMYVFFSILILLVGSFDR